MEVVEKINGFLLKGVDILPNRRSYKSDQSFLEKISIGATGTKRVYDDLQTKGHKPIELERGSMSFKIWKTIKIKRIRVPDLLCVDCCRRIESRAKTNLEISMSHSTSDPERSWDYGLDDNDLVALVACKKVGDKPTDWQASALVQYVSVADLRTAYRNGKAVLKRPKGAEEGFEARITWPAAITTSSGIVTKVTGQQIQYKRGSDGRIITLQMARSRQELQLQPLVSVGDVISEGQIIGAVVPVTTVFPCNKIDSKEGHYLDLLSNVALSKRYAAAKALSFFAYDNNVAEALTRVLSNHDEHIYVRLEAAASLARWGNEAGVAFMRECLDDRFLQNRLEAVIVLGEIATEAANQTLIDTLRNEQQHPEIRAGAAWALGELRNRSALNALIDSFTAIEDTIKVEAARALSKLAFRFAPEIVQAFSQSSPDKRPGIAWALSKSKQFTLDHMLNALVDDDARQWVSYILGTQDQARFLSEIERLKAKDAEVYFAVNVLWKIMSSWVYGIEEY